ncbi:hypothetical protein BGW41_006912 [Actinomortierella wolfii]|nr:hypothetical protein BGW41_006912 [Actinomortierella wolfii]
MEFMEYPEQPKMATEAIAYDQVKTMSAVFDTEMYEKLVKLQEEERRQQQLRQHRIWQHVQERVAQQQKLLEEEEAAAAAAAAASTSTPSTTNGDTNAAVQALFADLNAELSSSTTSSKVPALKDPSTFQKHKRSIRWSLQNNTIRRFDKNMPLQNVKLPPTDSRPAKSALKVRTPNGIQKPSATDSKYFPPRKTAVDFF